MLSQHNFLFLKTLQMMCFGAPPSIWKIAISGIKISCCFLKIMYILYQILEADRMQKVEMILEMIHAVTAVREVTLEINTPIFSLLNCNNP